ncbi:at dna binding [Pyrenophora seminiperda CCB06]|uniref:Thymocyte nuclear protein 1 n=1 Tax=Pyrenophora seminiperda CCB06 TaxID=1302712 RepID=A0A3M7M0G6_9PLEO|nr:at dna binding [Pyrenophora seminiperda CCB06]
MAATRRSTRQTTSAAHKYNENNSSGAEETVPKRNAKKTTRRKRARSDDNDNDNNDEEQIADKTPPPRKKAATSKAQEPKAKATPSKRTTTSKPSQPSTQKAQTQTTSTPSSPSPTNRDANGAQQVYWLLKAEPLPRYENGVNVAFSISDLRACNKPEPWSGVRNPQARNNMQAMRRGDLGFFYHSNAKPSGVVGILRVVEEAKVDETAFDPKDPYYDKKSDPEKPKWFCVGVEFVREFDGVVNLQTIKGFAREGGPLKDMQLVTNSRLSVCRVRKEEWDFIVGLAEGEKKKGDEGNLAVT